jgi:hypothetical protein
MAAEETPHRVMMIYGFSGAYSGTAEFDWKAPEVGDRHNCMLFLSQPREEDAFDDALAECARFGMGDIQNLRCGRLRVEVLNTDIYRGFACFYEEALNNGSSLLWYPHKKPDAG